MHFFRIVPESARWLVTRKKYHEAEKILQKIAHYNKTSLPSDWSKDLTLDEKVKSIHATYTLLRSSKLEEFELSKNLEQLIIIIC